MYKFRATALLFITLMFIPIVAIPVEVKADAQNSSVTDFSRLVGSATPVLSAVTSCSLQLIFENAYSITRAGIDKVSNLFGAAKTADNSFSKVQGDYKTKAENSKAHLKDICWKPIERAAAQVILNTMTTATINMINTGNFGSPFFDQNPQNDYKTMQKNTLLTLKATLSDKGKYPFGTDILKQTLGNYNSSYAKSMQVDDFNASFGVSLKNFGTDLASGGWDAFDAGFKPNNNPIGFNFRTQEHLNLVLDGTNYNPAKALKDELDWGHGFLSQKKCMKYGDIPDKKTGEMNCLETKIITPGMQIADSLNSALNVPKDSLLSGADLDSSITSILNALFTKLLQNGLTSLTDDSNTGSDSGDYSGGGDVTTKQTVQGNATGGSLCGVSDAGEWYNKYPQFDITDTDQLGEAATTTTGKDGKPTTIAIGLIAREKQLQSVLEKQNQILRWILTAIYKADQCIPGPSTVGDTTSKDKVYGEIMQNYSYPGSSVAQVNEAYNAQFLSDNLGIHYYPNSRISSPGQVQKIVKTVISRYYDAMSYQYRNLKTITVYNKTKEYYSKIGFYQQAFADNEAKIALIKGTIDQIKTIRTRVTRWAADGVTKCGSQSPCPDPRVYKSIKDQFSALIPDLDVSPYVSKH